MLVLSRKVGERILIGDQIAITVVRISGGGVRIGIEAPSHMAVVREELATKAAVECAAALPLIAGGTTSVAEVQVASTPVEQQKLLPSPAPRKAK